jgi:hypothetical protein
MSALTPELLASFDEPRTGSHTAAPVTGPGLRSPRRRRWALLAGAVVVAGAFAGAWLVRGWAGADLRAMSGSLPPAASTQRAPLVAPAAPQPQPQPQPPAPAPPAVSPPAEAAEATAAADADDKTAARSEPGRKRGQRQRVRAERDRILRGLSIDPFAVQPGAPKK